MMVKPQWFVDVHLLSPAGSKNVQSPQWFVLVVSSNWVEDSSFLKV